MNKSWIFIVVAALLLALPAAVAAKVQHGNLLLNRIVIIEDAQVLASVSIDNIREVDFDGGKVTVLIPELGVRASGRAEVENGERNSERVVVRIPKDAPAGEYWVRITVSNDDVKRVKHRIVTI